MTTDEALAALGATVNYSTRTALETISTWSGQPVDDLVPIIKDYPDVLAQFRAGTSDQAILRAWNFARLARDLPPYVEPSQATDQPKVPPTEPEPEPEVVPPFPVCAHCGNFIDRCPYCGTAIWQRR